MYVLKMIRNNPTKVNASLEVLNSANNLVGKQHAEENIIDISSLQNTVARQNRYIIITLRTPDNPCCLADTSVGPPRESFIFTAKLYMNRIEVPKDE